MIPAETTEDQDMSDNLNQGQLKNTSKAAHQPYTTTPGDVTPESGDLSYF